MRVALLSILTFLVITLSSFFAYNSYKNSTKFIHIQRELSSQKGVDESIQSKLDKIFEKLSIGIYDKYLKKETKLQHLSDLATSSYDLSITYAYYFFATIGVFLVLFYLIDRNFFIIFLAISSLVSLIFALISPLIMMVVYQSLPILGEVTLSFESKTIIGTINKMYSDKNYIIALLVLLFSVIIPIIKSLVLLTYGFLKESHKADWVVAFINKIGKWSMADVFIVAILVVFFSTKQDIHTSIKLEIGLYFFISYVLLSMVGSSMIGGRDG